MSRTSKRPWFLTGVLALASLGLYLLLTSAGVQVRPTPSRTIDLAPGVTSEGKIPADAGVVYRIFLKRGQLLHLSVEQHGTDVALVLLLPSGDKLYRVDSPSGKKKAENVYLVAPTDGDYGFRVESASDKDNAGRFLVRISELRRANGGDSEAARAEENFYIGNQLASSRRTEDLHQAEQRYSAALHIWESLDKTARQADVLMAMGWASSSLYNWEEAAKTYRLCAELRRRLHDWKEQADALSFAANAYENLGQLIQAESLYQEELQVRNKLPAAEFRTASIYNLARIQRRRGQAERAIASYSEVVDGLEGSNSSSLLAEALAGRALAYRDLGRTDLAQDDFERALGILSEKPDAKLQAATLTQAAMTFHDREPQRKAIDMLRRALKLRLKANDPEGEATTVNALGVIYYQEERYEDALDAFQRAAQIYKTQNQVGRQIPVLTNLGWIYAVQGQPEIALRIFNDALSLARAGGDKPAEAALLYGMAYAERRRGSLLTARARIEEALEVMESLRSSAKRQDFRTGYLALREDFYGFKIELLMDLHGIQPRAGYDLKAFQTSERARARGLVEDLAEDEAGSRLPADRSLLLKHQRLQDEINNLDQLLRAAGNVPAERARFEQELRMKLDQDENLEVQLRARNEGAKFGVPPSLTLWEIQKRILDPDTALLEYYLGKRRSFVWLVTPRSFHGYEVECPDLREMARRVHVDLAERGMAKGRKGSLEDWEKLSDCLLGPVSGELTARRLLIVPHDELQKIPFVALLDPSRSELRPPAGGPNVLSIHYEVVNVPSLSVLVALRRQQANRSPARYFLSLIADPVYGLQDERMRGRRQLMAAAMSEPQDESDLTGLSRLRGSEREAQEILRLTRDRAYEVALGFAANREWVMRGHIEEAEIVHFATHGIVNQEFPSLSGLVLSQVDEQGRRRDGLLRAHEIKGLNLKAQLVVLSACQTALGKDIRGEGLVGLTQSFLVGGASSVLVSLWKVDDRATAELMKRFYRALLFSGLPPATALRQAQLEMISDRHWQDPFYWAGFVLQGDWSTRRVTDLKK
jgi:CHAT domain-containing protein/Tfp pilus assembly protein PilF